MFWLGLVNEPPTGMSVASTTHVPLLSRVVNGSRMPLMPAVGVRTALLSLSSVHSRPSPLTARWTALTLPEPFCDSLKSVEPVVP
ncbi:hypothetical protein [Nocardia sp. NRRL S-836]|uniref:hypothetical protein n=1 Tax=Nocardia sp. NRRL S-836 TaxID=1519492 RepID=UPI0006ADBC87|nr:hypothetical protein [Nocardia sp. NRRL S-836]KOV81018.1 hypothetical protein ADL03_30625 [Nocardia sp. NRRL S-836]